MSRPQRDVLTTRRWGPERSNSGTYPSNYATGAFDKLPLCSSAPLRASLLLCLLACLPDCASASVLLCLSACLPCVSGSLPSFLSASLLASLSASLLPACVPVFLVAFLSAFLCACLLACLLVCLPACLLFCLPACPCQLLPACLPACLLVCLLLCCEYVVCMFRVFGAGRSCSWPFVLSRVRASALQVRGWLR